MRNPIGLLVFLIIGLSFFLFSTAFYPFVNSDDALNVLIAHTYHLPEDLYCWGQDRGGTLIPLISQIFIKPFGMPAYLAVSISNYIVLTLGFWGFSKLIRDKKILLLLVLFWFFPYQRFLQLTVFPIGMGYSLLGFSILFLRKIDWKQSLILHLPNLIRMGTITFIWLLAVWCSDLIFVSLLTCGGTLLLYAVFKKPKTPFNQYSSFIAFSGILVFLFLAIRKAKTYATGVTEHFISLNRLSEIGEAFQIVKNQSIQVLLGSEDFVLTLGAWLILSLLVIGFLLIIRFRKSIFRFEHFAINFFLLDFIAMTCVVFLSHWVLLNEMGRWYFVAPYITFGLFFILFIDQTEVLKNKTKFIGAVCVFVLLGSSSITNVLHFAKGKYKPMSSTLSELNTLGEIGILGNYWDAYRLSMVNPDKIKASPIEGGGVRNEKLVSDVFKQPKLYLSRDMWMDSFPDSLVQFGVQLYKKGSEFQLAGSHLCEYSAPNKTRYFLPNDLNKIQSLYDSLQNAVVLSPEKIELENQIMVFGPFVSLLPGKYRLKIHVEPILPKNLRESLLFDYSYNYGQNSSGFIPLSTLKYVQNDKHAYFHTTISTNDLLQQVEFRLLVKKAVPFTFLGYELISLH